MKGVMRVGDVVRLTSKGRDMLAEEYTNRETPPLGSTAVIKALNDVSFSNPAYYIEFFGYPGLEWEVYGGEVEIVGRG